MLSEGLQPIKDKNKDNFFQYFIGYGNFELIKQKLSRNKINKKEQYLIKKNKLKLSERKKKVEKYLGKIEFKSEKNIIFEKVKKLLKYDNSSENIIYFSFYILEKILSEEEFLQYSYQYRFCLFKDIHKGNFDKKYGKIKGLEKMEFLPKNELEIKKKYLNIISYFHYTASIYNTLTKNNSNNKEKIEKLLDFEIAPFEKEKNTIVYTLKHNIDNNLKLTNDEKELINQAKNALSSYLDIYEFEYFYPNIPIEYNNNPVLYYNYLIFYLYHLMVNRENKDEKTKLIFQFQRFQCYLNLENYMNSIFDRELDDGEMPIDLLISQSPKKITEQFVKKLKLLYFIIFSETDEKDIIGITENINNKEKEDNILTKQIAEDFFKINKFKNMNVFLDEEKFTVIKNGNYIRYYYDCFASNFLEINFTRQNLNINLLKEISYSCYFDKFNKQNYFCQNNPFFMNLIKKIIGSKFVKNCYEKYTNISDKVEYFLNDSEIINYIISKILFLPIYELDLNKTQAETNYYDLFMVFSGYPISLLNYKSSIIILELARKIIQILHELMHFIKRYLSIITNNMIISTTIESENEYNKTNENVEMSEKKSIETEAGKIFEHIIFKYSNEDKNEKIKNIDLKNKILDFQTAIKILDPDLYDNDVEGFINIIYNIENSAELKNYQLKDINKELKDFYEFLGIGKDIEHLKESCNSKISIARRGENRYCINIETTNHNLLKHSK